MCTEEENVRWSVSISILETQDHLEGNLTFWVRRVNNKVNRLVCLDLCLPCTYILLDCWRKIVDKYWKHTRLGSMEKQLNNDWLNKIAICALSKEQLTFAWFLNHYSRQLNIAVFLELVSIVSLQITPSQTFMRTEGVINYDMYQLKVNFQKNTCLFCKFLIVHWDIMP